MITRKELLPVKEGRYNTCGNTMPCLPRNVIPIHEQVDGLVHEHQPIPPDTSPRLQILQYHNR